MTRLIMSEQAKKLVAARNDKALHLHLQGPSGAAAHSPGIGGGAKGQPK
jgi:hypothetical protein